MSYILLQHLKKCVDASFWNLHMDAQFGLTSWGVEYFEEKLEEK